MKTSKIRRNRVRGIAAALLFLVTGEAGSPAHAQELPSSSGDRTIPVPDAKKSWRFFWEDGFNIGFSCDINPRSRSVIVYPHIATLAYLGPEFGINARTAGAQYFAVGVAQNVWISEPIVRLAYGRQSRRSFVEIGIIAFPNVGREGGEWNGPRVIPRLSLGTRF